MERRQLEQRKQILLDLMNDKLYVPMKMKELAIILQVSREERPQLEQVVKELLEEGAIQVSKRGKYQIAEETTVTGTYSSHPKGFGFLEVEGRAEDIFIPEEYSANAFHGDLVQAVLLPGRKDRRQEGKIIKVLSHTIHEVVGIYEESKNFGFVVPDDAKIRQDIFIPAGRTKGAVDGHKVVAEITYYGSGRRKPEGKITKIIGHVNDPGTDVLSIVYDREIPTEFPQKVLNQAERTGAEVTPGDFAGRLDLREVRMVTIDGEDAKDLDDAVSLSREGGLWRLGVHIADVSNYVQENSALDWEAKNRGTSVYLVDRVIPMLPHRLSNGICSLNAGCDRLALSCLMDIDDKGKVVNHRIAETVIRVDRRMSYTEVKNILEDGDEQTIAQCSAFVPMFEQMRDLSRILREKRRGRGAIDFDFPESKIILDKKGVPVEIKPYERNVATDMIEDFMLAANETVAQDYFWQSIPFVYRTHDKPDPEKVRELAEFVRNFGYGMKGVQAEVHPKELQKLLRRIADSPQESLIARLTLRSMKQARYSVDCTGHFGLAAKYYCHFTSPIRRYPDLQIHRIIKETLRGRMTPERMAHYEEILPQIAEHASKTERRADETERDVDKMKKAEYMQRHVGETYEGVISSITSWGMYVELPNTVEGLVHVANMPDDHYYYREETHEMIGANYGKIYKLGQRLRIRVLGADKQARTVDFTVDSKEE